MQITLSEQKYTTAPEHLRNRLFAFARAADVRECRTGSRSYQYLVSGPAEGMPVLFFTGGVKHPIFSFSVIEAFNRVCPVFAPVQPPCRTLEKFFLGVDQILEREKIDSFCVAGSSWGGQLAQVAALRYAQRVQRLVLANTGISSGRLLAALLRLHRWSAQRKEARFVTDDFRRRALKLLADAEEGTGFWEALFDDLYERYMSKEDYLSLIDTQIDYVARYASAVRRRGFAGPVLILVSEAETAGTAKMRSTLLRAYPHAQVHRFESGGHHPALLHLEEYRRVVEAFLSEPPA